MSFVVALSYSYRNVIYQWNNCEINVNWFSFINTLINTFSNSIMRFLVETRTFTVSWILDSHYGHMKHLISNDKAYSNPFAVFSTCPASQMITLNEILRSEQCERLKQLVAVVLMALAVLRRKAMHTYVHMYVCMCMYVCMDESMYVCMDRWMDGRTDGWMDAMNGKCTHGRGEKLIQKCSRDTWSK
jgi:hypothetical protein